MDTHRRRTRRYVSNSACAPSGAGRDRIPTDKQSPTSRLGFKAVDPAAAMWQLTCVPFSISSSGWVLLEGVLLEDRATAYLATPGIKQKWLPPLGALAWTIPSDKGKADEPRAPTVRRLPMSSADFSSRNEKREWVPICIPPQSRRALASPMCEDAAIPFARQHQKAKSLLRASPFRTCSLSVAFCLSELQSSEASVSHSTMLLQLNHRRRNA